MSEGLVGVVQQHVLLPDRGEHVAVMVLYPLGNAGLKRCPQKVCARFENQFRQVRQPDHARQFDDLGLVDVKLFHDHATKIGRRSRRNGEPDHLAPTTALECSFELADKVLGLFLDLQSRCRAGRETRNYPSSGSQGTTCRD